MKRHLILWLTILPTLLLAQSCPPGFVLQNPICCYAFLPEACSYMSPGIVTCIYRPATTAPFVVPLGVTALTNLNLVGGVGGDGVDKSEENGFNHVYMGGAATRIVIPSFAVVPGETFYVVVGGVGIGFIFDNDAGSSTGGHTHDATGRATFDGGYGHASNHRRLDQDQMDLQEH
ncbi:hypothetical protein RQP46_010202 [Phenoliferia psychrophenolica]